VLEEMALFYTGRTGNPRRSGPLPRPVRLALDIPQLYDPDDGLIAAANVALTLRLPLLLTGRPGTGKTEMARSLALTLDKDVNVLHEVTVTSASDKSDLLYQFDELGRLRDAYDPDRHSHMQRDYLRLQGLGAAIVAAGRPDDPLEPIVPGAALPDGLWSLRDLIADPSAQDGFFLPPGSPPPVVLLDEIDKAPRELPNDLLTELDRMRFPIPELGVRVVLQDAARWPVVVITSNAERPLSEAFLRRCVCYEVAMPGRERLQRIIETKLEASDLSRPASRLAPEVAAFVEELEKNRSIPLNEQPGIARVLDFSMLLADPDRLGRGSLRDTPQTLMEAALTALLPSSQSQKEALLTWQTWQKAAATA
jgi:MoxR-like ATPase